jgi:hypothetical protein
VNGKKTADDARLPTLLGANGVRDERTSWSPSGKSARIKHPFEIAIYVGEYDEVKSCPEMIPEVSLAAELLPQLLVDDGGKLKDLVHEEGEDVFGEPLTIRWFCDYPELATLEKITGQMGADQEIMQKILQMCDYFVQSSLRDRVMRSL